MSRRTIRLTPSRLPDEPRQRVFGFVERSRRLRRRFKFAILAATTLIVAGLLIGNPHGRDLAARTRDASKRLARRAFGLPTPRAEIEAATRRGRSLAVADVGRRYREDFPNMDEPIRRLFRYAGSDPDHGLLRWGNYDQTLLLPSTVFEADDSGRSYRLRPGVRSIWIRNVSPRNAPLTFLLVPDRPELAEIARGTDGAIVPGSVQTTNSWGLRGPEPDPSAPLRGIVLGDSFMQGLFIDDDHAPPELLRRRLEDQLGTKVSILNTGHLGYSPEQYYHTLIEYVDRFKPGFVVASLFANDFGGISQASRGEGDWEEGRYWLGRISQFCRSRRLIPLFVPAPMERQLSGRRRAGFYPGMISNVLEHGSQSYLDPIEAFVERNMAMMIEADRAGRRPSTSPLYNGVIGDGHFSAIGADLWAEVVARRLTLLLERRRGAE